MFHVTRRCTSWVIIWLLALCLPIGMIGQPARAATTGSATSVSTVYYISPTGSDTNAGSTLAEPWHTFAYAIPKLQPGDTLLLLDGTYQKGNTGLPYINCASAKDAHNGTSAAPITIQAQNERMALLQSDGSEYAFLLKHCAFWQVIGLRGASADLPVAQGGQLKSVFTINRSHDVTLKRLLSSHSNRYFNTHTYEIAGSSQVLIEESEAYFFHRHGFDIYQCSQVTVRRSYANSRSYADLTDGYKSISSSGGDESFALYYTSDSIIENSISQGNNLGFEIHGGPNLDGSPGGHNNQILGSIYLGGPTSHYGARIDTRKVDGLIWPTVNNRLKDFLVVNAGAQGIVLSSTSGASLENITIYKAGDDGIQVKETVASDPWCATIAGGCSLTVSNSLVYQSAGYGLAIRPAMAWLVENANVVANQYGNFYSQLDPTEASQDDLGHIMRTTAITPTAFGLGGASTLVYIADQSNMKGAGKNGADIGATLLYRYQAGTLTQAPLWQPRSGAFPCGATIAQVNDLPGDSCFDLHTLLNVNVQTLPATYGAATPVQTIYLPLLSRG